MARVIGPGRGKDKMLESYLVLEPGLDLKQII